MTRIDVTALGLLALALACTSSSTGPGGSAGGGGKGGGRGGGAGGINAVGGAVGGGAGRGLDGSPGGGGLGGAGHAGSAGVASSGGRGGVGDSAGAEGGGTTGIAGRGGHEAPGGAGGHGDGGGGIAGAGASGLAGRGGNTGSAGAATGGRGGQGGAALAFSFAPIKGYLQLGVTRMVKLGDVDGDGRSDVVSALQSYKAGGLAWINNGDGTFGTPPLDILPGENQADLALGDFSGDGRLDVIFTSSTNTYSSFVVNSGDRMFSTLFSAPTHIAGGAVTTLAVDFNGDGKMDFVADNHLFLNQGGGTFGAPTTLGAAVRAAADLNGDGKIDFVGGGDGIHVLLNRGDGTFAPGAGVPYAVGTGTGNSIHHLSVGDLNRDGRPDIATANDYGETTSVLLNKGDGSFGPATTYAAGPWPTSVQIGDMNGDGWPELVVANSAISPTSSPTSFISVHGNKGDGTFAPFEEKLAPFMFADTVALGDLNGDGKLDIAASTSTGLAVLLNTTP